MSVSSSKELWVALTIDTDSDCYFGDCFPPLKQDKSIVGWKGLEIGKNLIAEGVAEIAVTYGISIPLTWFIRCDHQIKVQYGDAAYLLKHYQDWWDKRQEVGDELQWHAHLYRQEGDEWVQETEIDGLTKDLEEGRRAMGEYGLSPSIIRVGEAYHSNDLMAYISMIGLKGDSTALPGRKRVDKEKTIDWEKSSNDPYRPSIQDYRVAGEPAHPLWEIPLNTVPTQVSYDNFSIQRYVNLAFQPGALDDGLESFMQEHDVLVSITHPFEVVPEFFSDSQMKEHPLLSFHSDSVKQNLKVLLSKAAKTGRKIKFVTMTQIVESLDKHNV